MCLETLYLPLQNVLPSPYVTSTMVFVENALLMMSGWNGLNANNVIYKIKVTGGTGDYSEFYNGNYERSVYPNDFFLPSLESNGNVYYYITK